jgi:hypothetical protein
MLNEQLINKWQPVLDHDDLPEITDSYRKLVTAQLLEQQEQALIEEQNIVGHQSLLGESSTPLNVVGTGMGASGAGDIKGFDPVLISLVRRTAPQMIAFDIMGTQPMSGPTGMVFALVPEYAKGGEDGASVVTQSSAANVFFDEANTGFTAIAADSTPAALGNTQFHDAGSVAFATATGMSTSAAELLGTTGDQFPQMGFRIDKTTVTAVSRALKAEYTTELAQDLKAIHGLDAESELSNILTTEINAEINREIVRTVYQACSKVAAVRAGGADTSGAAKLDGRWLLEKFESLRFKIEQEANGIAKATRRGKGNIMICSSDVASALATAGVIDPTAALKVDDTGSTMAGTIGGPSGIKVFIDPYASGTGDFAVVGYKGSSPYDAGLFYCPYVPLQMVRAIGEDNFQPKIGFKTRYGIAVNPFAASQSGEFTTTPGATNSYYRGFAIQGIGQVTA